MALHIYIRCKEVLMTCLIIGALSACSATKFVPDEQYLLESVEIRADKKQLDAATLEQYIRQKGNSKWFSLFKVPLGTYALSGQDTTKWLNRTLQRIGEKPVLFDTLQARLSCQDLLTALQNMGYMNSSVNLDTRIKGKKMKAIYNLTLGEPYLIHSIKYDVPDSLMAKVLKINSNDFEGLKPGEVFTVERLENERKRITSILLDSGYYRFHKEYIQYTADSTQAQKNIDLILHILKYRVDNDTYVTEHPRYFIRNVNFIRADSTTMRLREKVLENSTMIYSGDVFNASALQKTYNNFAKMRAVRYTNIHFTELPDTTLLDCDVQLSLNKPSSLSFQPEGTNTAGDLGAAATLTYENHNLFRGSENLSIQLRGAFEAITGLEGYQNQNYEEYSIETKLNFPRFLAPFLSRGFVRRNNATTELSLSWNLQNRPEFHRRVLSFVWGYRWADAIKKLTYNFDLLDLNYIYMPWISETFKQDYLDNTNSRNAILQYNYQNLFVMKTGFGIAYSDNNNAVRAHVETSGNVLNAVSKVSNMKKDDNGQYNLFNIAYAQYAKFDFDYTHIFRFDEHNSLALHTDFGIAYPYGNSTILPFEVRYFSGGANSVRGWDVRGLGPGKFKRTNGQIDFINQTGDMKLDLNLEYRTFLFWKLDGAFFVDAGNIWTLRNYADQPGGQFKFNSFYKQIAVAYGIGFRLNFNYFILRFDIGMKAINPEFDDTRGHYPIYHPDIKRDATFHFAVGLPF